MEKESFKVPAVTPVGKQKHQRKPVARSIKATKIMTKKQWFEEGYEDQLNCSLHPERILQETWIHNLFFIDCGQGSWQDVFNGFPHYKRGVLKATKELKI